MVIPNNTSNPNFLAALTSCAIFPFHRIISLPALAPCVVSILVGYVGFDTMGLHPLTIRDYYGRLHDSVFPFKIIHSASHMSY